MSTERRNVRQQSPEITTIAKAMEIARNVKTLEDFREFCLSKDVPARFWFRDGECIVWEWPIRKEHEAVCEFFALNIVYNQLIGNCNPPLLPLKSTGSATCIFQTADQGKDPDASFTVDGRPCPNLIVEVANSQSLGSLFQVCEAYLIDSQDGCYTMLVVGIKIISHGDNAELICILWERQVEQQGRVDQNGAEATDEKEEGEDSLDSNSQSVEVDEQGVARRRDGGGGARRVRRRIMMEPNQPPQAPPPTAVISFGNVPITDRTVDELHVLGVENDTIMGHGIGDDPACDRPGLELYQLRLPWQGLLTSTNVRGGPLPETVLRPQDWVLDLHGMQQSVLAELQMRRRRQR